MRPTRALFLLFFPLLAAADQRPTNAAQDNPFFLKQEITVTATRTEVEPSKTPVSASTVVADEIRLRNVQVVDRALDGVPGVYLSRGKGFQDTLAGVGMRGFSGRGSLQSRTLVLLDGQPLNDPYTAGVAWTALPVDEVERVEVVRGPFSALYGSNAMGGVIQILSKPVDRRRLDLRGDYGAQETFRYGARIADRFFDRWGLSLSYDRLQSGGYPSQLVTSAGTVGTGGTPVTGFIPTLTTTGARAFVLGDAGKNSWEQTAWRIRSDYAFNERTSLSFQYLRQASWYGYDAYHTYLRTLDGRPFDSGIASIFADGVSRRLSVTPSMFLPGDGGTLSRLASVRLYRSFSANTSIRVGAGIMDAPMSYYSTPGAGATLAGGPGTISDRPGRAWFGETQLNWDPGSAHSVTAGADLRRDASRAVENAVPNYARRNESATLTYWAEGKSYTQGIYAQHQWRAAERILVVWGGRYDYWRTFEGKIQLSPSSPLGYYEPRSNHAPSGKAAILLRAPAGIALRASAGNAYRNPTIYDLYRTWRSSAGTIFASNPDLKPEKVIAWEAGANRRWTGGFELDAVFFDNHVRDLIYRSTDFSRDPQGRYRPVINAARAHSRGWEVSARAPLLSWLFVRTAYTWTKAEITDNPVAPATVGKRIPYVPSHAASASLFTVRKRWSASFTGRYVSSMFSTDTNVDTTKGVYGAFDPFFVADASVSFDLTRFLVFQLSVDNLLNRVYYSYYPVPGRMALAGLRIRL